MADTWSRDLSPHLWLAQEEQLRASADPKHAHLSEDLHVEISTFASPSEAHARLALALSEVRAYLIPDSNDQIRQQQMRDIKMIKMSTPGSSTTNTTTSSTAEVSINSLADNFYSSYYSLQ